MAIVSSLIGGLIGFISFLMAFFLFDASFLSSLAVYTATGVLATLVLIAASLLWQAAPDHAPPARPDMNGADADTVSATQAQQ